MDFEYFYGKQSSQYAFYRIPKQLFTERQFDVLSVGAKQYFAFPCAVNSVIHDFIAYYAHCPRCKGKDLE